jgi:hypothetical protein
VPKYARATFGKDTKLKASTWWPIPWDNPTNGKDVFSQGNPGIDIKGAFSSVLSVSFDAGDKVGTYFTQAVEGNFKGPNGAWQTTQEHPVIEHAGTSGGTQVQHAQIQSVADGDKLRFRVKASQDCTVKGAQITILHW